jgi:cytochrome c
MRNAALPRLLVSAAILAGYGYAAASDAQSQKKGPPQDGLKAYQACAACHSLEPGRNLTGPSLANLFGRKAGTIAGFQRYSDALKRSGVVWNEQTLDAWLRDPAKFIPGNDMAFPGIQSDTVRRDLIAFLKSADSNSAARPAGPHLPDLKKAGPDAMVKSIRHCGDTYFVTTADGKTHKVWEFNLRFKTDTSESGPNSGQPVIVGAGMRGDRASVVFSSPAELGRFIKAQCDKPDMKKH